MHFSTHVLHKPQHPVNDVPDDFEPGSLPVEPDQGPIPTSIPDDPERDGWSTNLPSLWVGPSDAA